MILRNPSGNITEVDDLSRSEKLLSQGFMVATPSEQAIYKNQHVRDNGNIKIYFQTGSESPDGYGMSQKNLVGEMLARGYELSNKYEGQEIGIVYSYPYGLKELKTKVKILYSMFESTKVPEEWVEHCKLADYIFVPTKFCQDAFASRGIKTEILNLGYDSNTFRYQEKIDFKKFTFTQYNSFDRRKGWDILFKAFNEEFTKDDPVQLILKTVKKKLPFPIIQSEYPNIRVINGNYSAQELLDLLRDTNCFVFPSRGEGFGLTPLEALATGTPTMIPNGSGMSEYFNKKYFIEIGQLEKDIAVYDRFRNEDVGDMIEPSVMDLRKKMRYIVDNYQVELEKAKEGAKWVKENWTMSRTADSLVEILKDIKKPKKVVKKNGFITYTAKIGDKDHMYKGTDIVFVDKLKGFDPYWSAKRLKIQPLNVKELEGYDTAVWIDANIEITDPDFINSIDLGDNMMAIMPHENMNNISEEIDDCIKCHRVKDEKKARKMLEGFKKKGYVDNKLFSGSLIFWNLKHPKLKEFCNKWWWYLRVFSNRDQLSLPYLLDFYKVKYKIIDISKWDNPHFTYHEHKN